MNKIYASAAAAVLAGLTLAACSQAPPTVIQQPAQPAPTQTVIRQHRTIVIQPGQPAQPAPAPGGALTACGGAVYAGPDTSCPFALNVAASYNQSGGPDVETVYSPVTGQSYVMTYSVSPASGVIVATGGHGAYVQF